MDYVCHQPHAIGLACRLTHTRVCLPNGQSTVPPPEHNDEDDAKAQQVFTVSPGSSELAGFEQKLLTVSFHPPLEDLEKGWKQAKERQVDFSGLTVSDWPTLRGMDRHMHAKGSAPEFLAQMLEL